MSEPSAPAEATNFLYPFLDAEERDQESLLTDLAASARAKAAESAALRASTLLASAGQIATASLTTPMIAWRVTNKRHGLGPAGSCDGCAATCVVAARRSAPARDISASTG